MSGESEKKSGMAQRRILRLLPIMAANTVKGTRLCDLARALGVSSVIAYRDLKIMEDEGIAQRLTDAEDRWVLGPKTVQIALAFSADLARSSKRLEEVQHNYTREPG